MHKKVRLASSKSISSSHNKPSDIVDWTSSGRIQALKEEEVIFREVTVVDMKNVM